MQYLQAARLGLLTFGMVLLFALSALAAPYAALVMDARSGEVLYSKNADTRLHPASLTKMMTLYVVFDAIKSGEISADTMVKISKKAAAEQPSKLGLTAGQRIQLRYLIRGAAVKSANDAATALAEAVGGSEAAFARRMNRTAKALGMTRSTFKNAHGLTETGHLSTARDMTILGRHLFFDHPEYYNLFSRRSTNAGVRDVANTNRKFLAAYEGADGIKTGYTSAAGFNLVASARRGNERIIATVFGGRSTAQRNAEVARLLDLGFSKAPSQVALNPPPKPDLDHVQSADPEDDGVAPGKIVRVVRAVPTSPRPRARPGRAEDEIPDEMLVAMAESIEQTITAVQVKPTVVPEKALIAQPKPEIVVDETIVPLPRPETDQAPIATMTPQPRPEPEVQVARQEEPEKRVVVTRISTSGGHMWGINVGRFTTRDRAERMLLRTALAELGTLDTALRKVVSTKQGHDANFVGMTREGAALACQRLSSRNIECKTLGPV